FAFTCGFIYSVWCANSISSWSLKHDWEGKTLQATGYIYSLPVSGKYGTTFEFHLDKIKYLNTTDYPNSIIKLTWPEKLNTASTNNTSLLKAGDEWQFLIRLKRIHSTQNPGAFDYESWAFQKGIRASGSVMQSQDNKIISHTLTSQPLNKFRQYL